MISSTVARSHSGSPLVDFVVARAHAGLKLLRVQLRVWQERSAGRRELRGLTDRDLRDIGVTRSEAEAEARKPFWQV